MTAKMENIISDLCIDSDYTICSVYPFTITRKSTGHIVSQYIDKESGYVKVNIKDTPKSLHRLIGLQWIQVPDNLQAYPISQLEIDHINKIRTDFHIENLRWVTRSENAKNKTAYNGATVDYIDHLSDDAIAVTHYNKHNLLNLYYDNGDFYTKVLDNQYRKIVKHYNNNKKPTLIINYRNTEGTYLSITVSKFKQIYNIT